MNGRRWSFAVSVLLVALVFPGLARADTLSLDVLFKYRVTEADCPPGTPETTHCYPLAAEGVFPGLGNASLRWTAVIDRSDPNPECSHWEFPRVSVVVAGKGEIDLAGKSQGCQPFTVGSVAFVVTGGTGIYAGASGSGTLALRTLVEVPTRGGSASLAGSISVPGLAFDTTMPVLSGLKSRVVKTSSARGARVVFKVTAADGVDGAVPVVCKPGSGTRFKVGRTRVECSATDHSGNEVRGAFVVTVRRRPAQ